MRIAAATLTAVLLASCSATAPSPKDSTSAPPPAAIAPGLDGTAWTLSWVPDFELPAEPLATLRFEAGRATGSDGCNRYTASYTESAAGLRFGTDAAGTLMACPPQAEAVATRFATVLRDSSAWRIEGNTLTLLNVSGAPIARLQAQAEGLIGTVWQVTGFNNGREAVVSVLADTTLTLDFSTEGRLSGSAGCNTYMAGYHDADGVVHIDAPASTRKLCAVPDGVMEQEQAFLAALPTATTARREGSSLELRSASGALVVSARLAP
jgi:heat shock protein HslJ